MAISYYKKEFARKSAFAKDHRQAFNLEKEAKIINPHKVEDQTTNRNFYKGTRGPKAAAKERVYSPDDAPIQATSHYQQLFPNWKNGGGKDIFHEKHPQFPVYSLPYRVSTTYKDQFVPNKTEELRRQTKRVQSGQNRLPITNFHPQGFDFETTNNRVYQDFRFNRPEKVIYQTPAFGPVETQAPGIHFSTTNKKELKTHNYKKPDIDRIPYP